jgi:hypothetical protein
LDFLPLGVLSGLGEHFHPLHLSMEPHIHLVRGPLQAQDGDLLPLGEEDVLDKAVTKHPEPEKKYGYRHQE